jgi:ankyrin repeat protein
MKKSAVIIAIALGFSFTTLHAANDIVTNDNVTTSTYETVTKRVVDPFCISIVKGDIDTVKKLIELGQDVNKKSNGLTPAMYAAKYNRLDILKLLVDKGAKLNVKSAKGMTAQKYAELSNAKDALAYIKGLDS